MYLEKFSKNLLNLLDEKGMNQTDLAKEMGVCKSAVTNWVRAYREPTLSNICKILEILNCTFDELVD